jgi:hypothetical protein
MRPAMRSKLKVIGVICALVALLVFFKFSTDHPTRSSVIAHINRDAQAHRLPHLSDAELRVLAEEARRHHQQAIKPHWDTEQTKGAARHALGDDGQLRLLVGYDDGYFYVSDVHHRVTPQDGDPLQEMVDAHSVAAGGPGRVIVGTCCEGNETPVELVLRGSAPKRIQPDWNEVTDIDLDLPTGRLAFTSTGGTSDVVTMRVGRYRMRISGRGAHEFQQDRERFRIDVWPRAVDQSMRVLDRTD